MRLSQTKEIYICPIKRLLFELDESLPDRKTVAILLTMKEINHPNLGLLDAYYRAGVFDTEIETRPFSFDYAEGMRIMDFLEREKDFERLYVCCDSGESRSTAMAAAIMRYYKRSDKQIWTNPRYHPNMLVYKKQCEVFGERVSGFRMKYLRFINKAALRKKIKAGRRRYKSS